MRILIFASVISGAFVFSLIPIISAKFFSADFLGSLKFNLYFLPFNFIANIFLAWGFMQGAKVLGNTPLLIGMQITTTTIIGAVLSVLWLNQKISIYGIVGILMLICGIILLNIKA